MAENVPKFALFICFGAMSNVGMMTGLAAIEAIKQVEAGKTVVGFPAAMFETIVERGVYLGEKAIPNSRAKKVYRSLPM